MITKADKLVSFISDYREFENRFRQVPAVFLQLRNKGEARFNELGFPSTKDEEWKYTNLSPLIAHTYQIPRTFDLTDLEAFQSYCDPAEINIVFINGQFSPQWSHLKDLPKGVTVTPLAKAVSQNGPQISNLLEKHNLKESDAFVALNNALLTDGAYVRIDDNTVVDRLIHIVHIASLSHQDMIVSGRSLISIGISGEADIMESHIASTELSYFTNALTDIFLEENANLRYCKAQNENQKAFHIGTTRGWQKRDSNLETFSLTTGAALSRHNLTIMLEEPGATAQLNGLYTVKNNQLVDNHTLVDHRPPNCTSNQLYKGILNDDAHAVFNGKIFVHKEAQQTNSYQLNKNLLLGTGCRVDTKPQLEIFADDVKCTHGATIGQLNEDEMFYLKSRGIPKELAVKLLARGFVDDILSRIKNTSVCEKLNKLLSSTFSILQ